MRPSRMFLSVSSVCSRADEIAYQSAGIASAMQVLANASPMYSSVHNNISNTFGVETGAVLTLLGDVSATTILRLWERLRQVLGVHCVWLDYTGQPADGDDYEFSGCVCNWPYYAMHHDTISHDKALSCSEY